MTARIHLAVTLIVLAYVPAPALAQTAGKGDGTGPLPAGLSVPAGHAPFATTSATGTQNYICLPAGAGQAWRFLGPQATLFVRFRSGDAQQVATHFLAANVDEDGTPRPVWQHSFDSSRVWARVVASSSDPDYVEPGAIPWLLLEAVGAEDGPAGGSFLAATTFIHRVDTSGGTAPAAGCSRPADVGQVVLVPYTTKYVFYRAVRRR